MKVLISVLVLLSFTACNEVKSVSRSDERKSVEPIKEGSLDGKIGKNNWSYLSGRVKTSYFDKNEYSLELWDYSSNDPCNEWGKADVSKILGRIPKNIGSFDLGNERNVTFTFKENGTYVNYIATEGKIVVSKIEGDFLEGKMVAQYDNENYVNGSFRIQICSN